MTYTYAEEDFRRTYPEVCPLYHAHYGAMRARMAEDGIEMPAYRPRVEAYMHAFEEGRYLHFVARHDGRAVGYCNGWLTSDMHNGDLIAREDCIYVHPDHRRGVGKKLLQFALADLGRRGVHRLHVHAATDPRVVNLWKRMGFRPAGMAMTFQL